MGSPPSAAKLFTVAEAAHLTSTSSRFWWRLIAQGRVPSVRLGRARRIRREDIEAICQCGLQG
jgi:excisionase family DNA binding protein